MSRLTPEILLRAYATGIFPMAEDAEGTELFWVDPDRRGILPMETFHVPRRLRKTVRQNIFEIRCDSDFPAVIRACASPGIGRARTWINREIMSLFLALHEQGAAHSVEAWYEGRLVGGLYGLALQGAFFGESMFSRASDASKVALVHLLARLVHSGFVLLDTQFVTEHLRQFGALEIPRAEYRRKLARALRVQPRFQPELPDEPLAILQSSTQTS